MDPPETKMSVPGTEDFYPAQLRVFVWAYWTELLALNVPGFAIKSLLSNHWRMGSGPDVAEREIKSINTIVQEAYEGGYLESDSHIVAANAAMEKLIAKDGFSKLCWIPVSELEKRKAKVEWGEDEVLAMPDALETHQADVHHNCDLSAVLVQSGDGHGTGILWDTTGHVVTNNHVVVLDDAVVTFSSTGFQAKSYRACILKRLEDKDLVVLKIQALEQEISWLFRTFEAVVLNEGETPRMGHEVFCVGYPYDFEKFYTDCKIQGFPVGPLRTNFGEVDVRLASVIRINAPIYPGNSGGPLFNHAGHLIGVVAAFPKRSVSMPISVGYAIPLSTVRHFVNGVIMNQH